MFLSKNDLEDIEKRLDAIESASEEFISRLDRQEHHSKKRHDEVLGILNDVNINISNFSDSNNDFMKRAEEQLLLLTDYTDKLRKRIESFKLLEESASKKLMEQTESEIKDQLQALFYTTKEYKNLEKGIGDISSNISSLMAEINKFVKISSEIKASDFIMVEHARRVSQMDAEKLRLMRENDALKKIISRERRSSH